MTEFTFAPGEKNIIGDRFSPSVIIFWLKTSIAASSTRIQYTTPNTLFGLIPLGADTKTIPLRNVASVDTSTKFNLGSLVWGVVFLLIGLGCLDSSVAVALVLILVAAIMERHRGDERAVLSFSRVSNLPEGLPDWVRAEESVKRRAAAVREAAVLLEAEGVAVDYTYMPEETE